MINDLKALLHHTQDTMHHLATFSSIWEVIKHLSGNKAYISDEQLHTMECCIYHGIQIQVEGLEGE
jgi:hypothetical protein